MHEIFISYRRSDSMDATGRLHDWLDDYFGPAATFRDIDAILGGEHFPERLERALDDCRVVLVVIGPSWAGITGDSGERRITEEKDHVRREVERAIVRGKRIIPVLVSGAPMVLEHQVPAELRPLCQLHAQPVEPGKAFRAGLEALIGRIANATGFEAWDYPGAVRNCRSLQLASTWRGLMSTDPAVIQEMQEATSLTMILNDGRGFIDAMRESIRVRGADARKTTRIVTLHPRSRFLETLCRKNGKSRTDQIDNIYRGFDALTKIEDGSTTPPRIDFRGSYLFFPSSYVVTERCAFVSPYLLTESGALPVFQFVHANSSPTALYPRLWQDANSTFDAATPLSLEDFPLRTRTRGKF